MTSHPLDHVRADPDDAERRLEEQVRAWAFAQAVLSAVWALENGCTVSKDDAAIALARTIRPLLTDVG